MMTDTCKGGGMTTPDEPDMVLDPPCDVAYAPSTHPRGRAGTGTQASDAPRAAPGRPFPPGVRPGRKPTPDLRALLRLCLEMLAGTVLVTFLLIVATSDNGQPPDLAGLVMGLTVAIVGFVVVMFVWLFIGECRARVAEHRMWRKSHERQMEALRRATTAATATGHPRRGSRGSPT